MFEYFLGQSSRKSIVSQIELFEFGQGSNVAAHGPRESIVKQVQLFEIGEFPECINPSM